LDEGAKEEKKVDDDRRTFLKVTVVASAVLAVGGMAALAKVVGETGGDTTSVTTQSGFPKVLIADVNSGQVANVNTLTVNVPLTYYYPLDNESNILVKLGVAVDNGVGPDGDIVSFSDICQHLGCNPAFVSQGGSPPCNPSYVAQGGVMYCCCHGSIYDLANDAAVISGPAPRPVPRVILEVDSSSGDIYATSMGPPVIWSDGGQHGPLGSDDVSYDLQGGTLVSSTSVSS
jgi:arsenite oxidase small subunit